MLKQLCIIREYNSYRQCLFQDKLNDSKRYFRKMKTNILKSILDKRQFLALTLRIMKMNTN